MKDTALHNLTFPEIPATDKVFDGFASEERNALELINRKVAAGNSLEDILNFLFDETEAIMPCDRIGLSFLEEDGKRISSHWARAKYEPVLLAKGYSADMEGSSLQTVLQSGRPRIINDLEMYAQAHPGSGSTRLLLREGVRSSLTCPLVVDGRPVGFLFRSSREPGSYTEREVRLHQAIAERLSQAVEKAHRIEQLTAANSAYMEMLGFVSHELKNPLASIIAEGKLLTGGYLGDMDEKQREMTSRMVNQGEYLLTLIRDYLDLARIESGQLRLDSRTDVNLVSEVIDPAVDLLLSQFEEKHIKLQREETLDRPADCDPDLLKVVMVNLLGNAVKYGVEDGEVRLTAKQEDGRLAVSVWNNGPGFPTSEKQRLFRRFSRLQTPELRKQKGSGLGLYVSWQIIQLHGGRIWAESEEGSWARFSFEIPQSLVGGESSA